MLTTRSNILLFFLLVSAGSVNVASSATVSSLSSASDLNQSITRLERLIQARNHMQIEMQNQLEQLSGELDDLRGMVEKNTYQLDQLVERQRDIYKEIDAVRKEAKSSSAAVEPKKEVKQIDYSNNQSENEEYDSAVNLILKERNYQGAAKAFNQFLAKYPNSVYKPNAHYWLGQLYFSMSDLDSAQKHFTSVSGFDQSSKRADAILKLGLIAQQQGDAVEAKDKFRQVMELFPNTTSANQAAKHLKSL